MPLPQSIQIFVSPVAHEVAAARPALGRAVRTRAPQHDQRPRPALHRLDLGPEEAGGERAEGIDVAARHEVARAGDPGSARRPTVPASSSARTSNAVSSALDTSTTSRPIDVADRAREQGVVRAPEDERVDAGVAHRCEQAFGEHVHLVGLDVAGLDELDEAGTGRARELEVGVERVGGVLVRAGRDVPTVPMTPTRPDACHPRRGAHPGRDHPDDRDRRTGRRACRARPTPRCCTRRRAASRPGRRAGRRSRARTS